MGLAGGAVGGVEGERVGFVLGAAAVEYRGQIGAAAEPPFAGDDHARVHVHGGDVRVPRMDDQRHAGAPELGAILGAGHLIGEIGGELAVDGGDMDARLFEHAAVQHATSRRHRRQAIPGVRSNRPGSRSAWGPCDVMPRCPRSSCTDAHRASWRNQVAAMRFLGVDIRCGAGSFQFSNPSVWRLASPTISVAARATLIERKPSRIGMRTANVGKFAARPPARRRFRGRP
jgi:hypothetical protein